MLLSRDHKYLRQTNNCSVKKKKSGKILCPALGSQTSWVVLCSRSLLFYVVTFFSMCDKALQMELLVYLKDHTINGTHFPYTFPSITLILVKLPEILLITP